MHIDYLIIGGGILGQAIAWELSQQVKDKKIVLLEKNNLSQGTTSQAAALVTQGRNTKIASSLALETLAHIQILNEQYQQDIPFHAVGGLHVAFTQKEMTALESMAHIATSLGIQHQWLTANESHELCPMFEMTQAIKGLYFPEDGYVDGAMLADAYGRSARLNGVSMLSSHEVSSILPTDSGYQVTVSGSDKIFETQHVIVTAGPWAAALLKPLAIKLPVASMRSLYWITERCLEKPDQHPVCVVPSAQAYFRPELNALLFGVRDAGVAIHPDQVPECIHGFDFPNAPAAIDALENNWTSLAQFWPGIEQLGLASEITGISSYSPDGLPVIGSPHHIDGITVVSGCSGAGITYGGGIAKYAVQHALDGCVPKSLAFERFTDADAYDAGFRQRCLSARSQKTAG